MRILYFADNYPPEVNAPAVHIHERCLLWARDGHDVTVITCVPNFPEGKIFSGYRSAWRQVEHLDGVRVVRVWSYIAPNRGFLRRSLDYASFVLPAVLGAVREQRPDVVVSSSPHLLVPLAGIIYCMLRRVPHVFELRDLWPASTLATISSRRRVFYRSLERLELLMYRRSARILCFTNAFADDLQSRGVQPSKIDVVYGGASIDLPRQQHGNQIPRDKEIEEQLGLKDRFVVGYLGTLGLAHGLDNVLNAAELLRDEPITFMLVGAGAERESLVQDVRRRRLSNVVFAARQPRDVIGRYWSVCDVALVHLRDEPVFATVVPSKVFEAMAMGKPILFAGPQGETSALINEHQAGITVESGSAEHLAAAVRQIVTLDEDLAAYARNSLKAVSEFTRARQAEHSLRVLRKAAEEQVGESRRRLTPTDVHK